MLRLVENDPFQVQLRSRMAIELGSYINSNGGKSGHE